MYYIFNDHIALIRFGTKKLEISIGVKGVHQIWWYEKGFYNRPFYMVGLGPLFRVVWVLFR